MLLNTYLYIYIYNFESLGFKSKYGATSRRRKQKLMGTKLMHLLVGLLRMALPSCRCQYPVSGLPWAPDLAGVILVFASLPPLPVPSHPATARPAGTPTMTADAMPLCAPSCIRDIMVTAPTKTAFAPPHAG